MAIQSGRSRYSVPDEEDFLGGFCGKAHLREVRCEERFGPLWFNFDEDAPTLEDFLGNSIPCRSCLHVRQPSRIELGTESF